ncbi:MAG TPA: hypothetical protein VNC50_03735, partial [Planctomycetia bacterium]|nr:hypothetical protein [Planctomycetia bacterium]
AADARRVQVRYRNAGGKPVARAVAHLLYRLPAAPPVDVTFAWKEASGGKTHRHSAKVGAIWTIPVGADPKLQWVEIKSP